MARTLMSHMSSVFCNSGVEYEDFVMVHSIEKKVSMPQLITGSPH